ncbi:MAG TPA: GNAT family N-acetyltransferase [Cyclobacteriaceae bacterium]|nr:GNAT family N-acetyltransferase [Cyclobacteriaceae bacterium]
MTEQPVISHIEPVIPVTDIVGSVHYWQDVLGFPNHWFWGEPPVHAGISWHGAFVQFSKVDDRSKVGTGSWFWIRVQHIDELYRIHKERKAEIVTELQHRPWGFDEYCVKDINGYYIIFSGNMADRKKSGTFPNNIRIVERKPTLDEFIEIRKSVGWFRPDERENLVNQLNIPVYGVVAEDTSTGEAIGCALVMSDNASFYYVKDVMVKKEWQAKRIGAALMSTLSAWIDANGVPNSLVGLYTGDGLENFYKQFGFSKSFGMVKTIKS